MYLNVDIVGTCFVMLTLATILRGSGSSSLRELAIVPGVLAGLATASKYTLVLGSLPIFVGIGLLLQGVRRVEAWCAAAAATMVSFLVVAPFSFLDIPGFLNGLAALAHQYANGHPGYSDPPGWPQVVYYTRHFASELGAAGVILAVFGAGLLAAKDWRQAFILVSFPLALLALLATQRTHFPRNVLSLHPIVAILVAQGVVAIHGKAMSFAERGGWVPALRGRPLGIAACLFLTAVVVPWPHAIDQLRDHTDSRTLAQAWILERVPPEWSVVVPSELGVDRRPLEAAARRIEVVELRSARDATALQRLLETVPRPAVILAPRWGADPRFEGRGVADALNQVGARWQSLETFGSRPLLVNYMQPAPLGDPAFAVAILEFGEGPEP
jgi:hypothetical protein